MHYKSRAKVSYTNILDEHALSLTMFAFLRRHFLPQPDGYRVSSSATNLRIRVRLFGSA